jgi:hypothetical protein
MAYSVNIAQSPRDSKLTCPSETDLYPIVDPVFSIALATQPFPAAVGRIKEPWPSLSLFRASFDRVVDYQHQDRANHGYD